MLPSWAIGCCILVIHICVCPVSASNASCPTWFYFDNTTSQCKCGKSLNGKINCKQWEMKAEIAEGFCATFSGEDGLYYAGFCPFGHTKNNTNRMYSELPSDPDQLNDAMCGPYNRRGLLCGRCIDGYGPTVNSLDMKCADCSKLSTGYAVCLYLLLELSRITLGFICVVIFHLNIMAGPLLGYVIFCQVYVVSAQRHLYIYNYILSHVSSSYRTLFLCSLTLSEVWTPEFIWSILPSFCISEHLTGIHIQMFTLLTGTYPIVLVVITCILIELHARHYRIIRILWKPIGILLKKTNITTATSDAVIHAFATFIFLSATNLTNNISFIFTLYPVYRSIDGSVYGKIFYFDPTISHRSILYVIAVVPFIILVLIPSILLCVYPTQIYRYLSRFISARKRLAITAFVEALHNCFKDGLNGTRDYRALAGFMMLVSIFGPIADYTIQRDYSSQFTNGIVCIFLSFIIAYLRPCKLTIANFSLSYHSMVLGIFSIADGIWKHDLLTMTYSIELTFIVVPVISHILVFLWAGYVFTRRILAHFGYQIHIPSDFKTLHRAVVNVVKYCYHRRRRGYQELNDATIQ